MTFLARLTLVVLTSLILGLASQAMAHGLGLAQVTVSTNPDGTIVLLSKLSATVTAEAPRVPGACTSVTEEIGALDPLNQRLETRILCPDGVGDLQVLLPWPVDGVFLISQSAGLQSEKVFIPAGSGGVTLNLSDIDAEVRGALDVASLYVKLGTKHILIGYDHLALLLCLTLLARGMVLVRLVTAFTIGHSITLVLAALQVTQIPVAPIEALIVLSVAYLAREVWLGRTLDRNSTFMLIGIGLLHGLGFASVLSEIGLPQGDLLLALLSFNIGIEIGQLMFIAAAVAVPWAFGRFLPAGLRVQTPAVVSFALGTVAMYWAFERIAAFYV